MIIRNQVQRYYSRCCILQIYNYIAQGNSDPVFDISDCGFMVRFDALKSALINNVPENVPERLTGLKKQIYEMIKQDPYISRTQIALKCDKSVKTIGRYLSEMNDLIQHIGPARGGQWIILSDKNKQ